MKELILFISNSNNTLFFITAVLISIVAGYFSIISFFGWKKRIERVVYNGPSNNYAIVIAAHNEESVIEKTVTSIGKMNYPSDKYDIFVVADNCSDNTARKAGKCGAIVYERTDLLEKGKGHALKWMFDILFKLEKKYDAVLILDADNLVTPDFLTNIDKKMAQGYKVVQGYRDIKNPWETWITMSYSISYWLANRLCQLPRQYLGINCTLTGSGYAVELNTLKKIGWDIETLTEDIEFYFQLCLNNIKIGWAHDAKILDEQPTTLAQSWKQRKRWMQGHFSCIFLYGKRVLDKAVNEKSLQAFDSLIMLLYPPLYVIGCLLMVLQGFCFIVTQMVNISIHAIIIMVVISILSYMLQNLFSLYFLVEEKKSNKKLIIGLILMPLFNLTWVPIMIQGYFSRKNKEWAHIAHSGSVT